MKAIIGLGNPGKDYHHTRHNVGFVLLDWLAERHGSTINTKKHQALIADCWIKENKVLLIKPQTWMNLSGDAVNKVAQYHDLSADDMLVVYDDYHLELPNVRFRPLGGAGGHNGIKSIISHRGEEGFSRMRIGIGPKVGNDTSNFVLGTLSSRDRDDLDAQKDQFCDMMEYWTQHGIGDSMNRFNAKESSA